MAIRIDRGQLEAAFDSGDGMMRWYLDRQTGDLVPLSEWDELEEEEEIRAAVNDDGDDRYLEVPSLPSHEGFRIMEDFARTMEDGRVRGALLDALERRRPFRSFKDALEGFPGVREAWFAYHDERLGQHAKRWLAEEGIEAEMVPFVERSGE
jgi:hypothetical protein